jgi:hypothetical protein
VSPPSDPGGGSVIRGAAWSKQLEYDLPAQWDVDVRETREQGGFKQGLAFTLDGPGPYGVRGGSTATPPPDARGIVVAEVTGATAHNPTPVGIDGAERFLQRLQEVTYFRFTVGPTSETTLAGFPALAADVQGGHLDAVSAMDFGHPSRALVADVDGGILVVQIWATSTDRLEAWLSEAMAFVSTFRFAATQVATCWSNPATPVSLGGSGRLTLPGTAISIDYTIPDGLGFSAESQPGVIGLAEGGSGLSYGSGPGGPGRGIVIGEAGSAQPHSGGASPTEPFGADARSIFDGVAAMPQLEVQGGYVLDAPGDMIGPGAIFVVSPDLGALPTHIDRVGATGRDCLVDFLLPNATYFVDLDGEVLILQVWAIDREALSRWLTEANAFIETLRFRVERPAG